MNRHRLIFAILMVIWTWLLLKPNPVPEMLSQSLLEDVKFYLSKCVHFGTFAFLAFYGTYRMSPANWKWLWLFLFFYGIASEIGQYIGNEYFGTNRHGCIQDVLIDTGGVLLGAHGCERLKITST